MELVKKINKNTLSIITDIGSLLNKIQDKYDYINKIIIIQRYVRKKYNNINLILLLNNEKSRNILKKCYSHIHKVMILFPPKKNENKFIYGKLIEKIIIRNINDIVSCYELDSLYEKGSCYKNDCRILGSNYSYEIKI